MYRDGETWEMGKREGVFWWVFTHVYPGCLPYCFRIDFRMFLCSLSGSIFFVIDYSCSLFLFIILVHSFHSFVIL